MTAERLVCRCLKRTLNGRPAILLGCNAVLLILGTLGILAGLAVAMQTILVHPVAREVLSSLCLSTSSAMLQDIAHEMLVL